MKDTCICRECKKELNYSNNFYSGMRICKNCLHCELIQLACKLELRESMMILCGKYDLYFDINLLKGSASETLGAYMRQINSLPQYRSKRFKDSVFNKEDNKDSDVDTEKMSTIDFLDMDIEKVKKNILKSVNDGSVNEHGKWLQSLRDAVRLKQDLEYIDGNKDTNLYFDVSVKGEETCVYCDGEIKRFKNCNFDEIANFVDSMVNDKNVDIYGDYFGLGLGLADALKQRGYSNFKDTKISAGDKNKGLQNGNFFRSVVSTYRK